MWDADRLRDAVHGYVITHLGCEDASLVIDDTQAQKKGTKSVGAACQHCGLTGDVRNCQTMVMLTYATADGHAFIDRHLYLPEEWTNDRRRCREAGVPDEIAFATKPELAISMPARCTCRSPGCGPTPATAVIRSSGLVPRPRGAVRGRRPRRPPGRLTWGQAAPACRATRRRPAPLREDP
ncbi:transposase [Streptomyces mirabilis]|uniref:transposase n=1 Tax=Streptomyces mirabilis TaxID=68239 RepID=UPI0036845FAD